MSASDVSSRLARIFLSELDERLTTFDADLLALEKPSSADEQAETVTRLFRDAHSLKGAAASVGAGNIEMICQQLEDTLAALRDGTRALDDACCDGLFAAADALREAGLVLAGPSIPEDAPSVAAPVAVQTRRRAATLRIASGKIDTLLEQSGELLVAHHRTDELYRYVVEVGSTVQRLRDAPVRTADAVKRQRDELHELHRSIERIAAAMQAERSLLQRAANELDDGIRSIRMVPFGSACDGLDRVARDAAKATGKRVRLEIAGADAGVDRASIERLRDSLVHLVRNAIDHGIELPDERLRRGKPAEGTIRLTGHARSPNFEITVTDDGRGLDLEHLRRRVRERGIDFDEADLARAVFLPGVSTAQSVTNLSGRGVGLDVVRSEVEAMSGSVEVSSTPDRETTFTLTFPLTSTTMRAILVSAGGQTFGINVNSAQRVVPISSGNVVATEGRTVLLNGDKAIPLVPLHAVLGIDGRNDGTPEPVAIIVSNGGRTAALAVDALIDEREIHIRSLGPRVRALPHIAGATVAGDGSVHLILRSSTVLESALSVVRRVRPPVPVADPLAVPAKRVLLVDDSVTTRTLERSILEAAGFEVLTAADGQAAWELLGDRDVDLVVSDVDMPRMDGFALVEAIRGSTSLRELPVILVTARENEIDRQRGLDIGADAYIVKSSFRQEELLDAIGALT
jgi:two-component system, chemotaxis family, sensor kinase CheA